MENSTRLWLKTLIAEIAAVALLWALLFELNRWLFSFVAVSEDISWVFLPAALRVAAVLVLGWRGSLGLFVGAMFTNYPVLGVNMLDALLLSMLSATSPLLSVELSKRCLGVSADLAGLTFRQLAVIAVVGAATSAVAHNVYFSIESGSHRWTEGLASMFGGDVLGTLAVLYVAASVLRRLRPLRH